MCFYHNWWNKLEEIKHLYHCWFIFCQLLFLFMFRDHLDNKDLVDLPEERDQM